MVSPMSLKKKSVDPFVEDSVIVIQFFVMGFESEIFSAVFNCALLKNLCST